MSTTWSVLPETRSIIRPSACAPRCRVIGDGGLRVALEEVIHVVARHEHDGRVFGVDAREGVLVRQASHSRYSRFLGPFQTGTSTGGQADLVREMTRQSTDVGEVLDGRQPLCGM